MARARCTGSPLPLVYGWAENSSPDLGHVSFVRPIILCSHLPNLRREKPVDIGSIDQKYKKKYSWCIIAQSLLLDHYQPAILILATTALFNATDKAFRLNSVLTLDLDRMRIS
jgi:hypothetical protein